MITLVSLPGHSLDVLAAYIRDDKILFASDAMTPVPMIADGDPRQLIDSLKRVKSFGLESIVQGHGEMISVNSNINYLNRILALVASLIRERRPRESVREYGIESCGKSRIPLHGLVQQFHFGNLHALYEQMRSDPELYRMGLRLMAEREAAKQDSVKAKPVRASSKKASRAAAARPRTARSNQVLPAASARSKKPVPTHASLKARAKRK
jgi:glyoxylase-like metal-dependent hydrolase (beta-lactamase superfamily II)